MSDIVHDLSPRRLITAIEQNMFAWIPVFGRLGQAHMSNPAGVRRSITDRPLALFNSVVDAQLAPEEVDAAIECVVSDGRSHNVPVRWWITPSTRPADLAQRLQAWGFAGDGEDAGMAIDLVTLPERVEAPLAFSIRPVHDDASRRHWAWAMPAGFEIPAPYAGYMTDAWYALMSRLNAETTLLYTGWLGGEPVATSLLFLGAGVAGIYAVSTIPEARRRGVGACMTLHPLLQARRQGYRVGILQASRMGVNMYASLGFKTYCQVGSYTWRPGA